MSNYSAVISVKKSPHDVFNAICDVKAWWIGSVEGDAKKVGSVFNYTYKTFHTSTQKVIELVPDKKIVWRVEDATLSFANNKSEWKGTEIVFEITGNGDQTEIHFTHKGLTPQFECYEACSGGWDFYITKSLKNLLTDGVGVDPGW